MRHVDNLFSLWHPQCVMRRKRSVKLQNMRKTIRLSLPDECISQRPPKGYRGRKHKTSWLTVSLWFGCFFLATNLVLALTFTSLPWPATVLMSLVFGVAFLIVKGSVT